MEPWTTPFLPALAASPVQHGALSSSNQTSAAAGDEDVAIDSTNRVGNARFMRPPGMPAKIQHQRESKPGSSLLLRGKWPAQICRCSRAADEASQRDHRQDVRECLGEL